MFSNNGYFKNNNDYDLSGITYYYDGNDYVDVVWTPTSRRLKLDNERKYINIIILQEDLIIGYAVIQINYLSYSYDKKKLNIVLKKSVLFPDVIDGKIEMTKEIVNVLINEENDYFKTELDSLFFRRRNYEFVEDNTNNDIIIREVDNQLALEDAFKIIFQEKYFKFYIYSEDAYFIKNDKQSHKIVIDSLEYWENEETSKLISLYWDATKYEEQNDIKSIAPTHIYCFIEEHNKLVGFARIIIEKSTSDWVGHEFNRYFMYISCQIRFFTYENDIHFAYPSIYEIYELIRKVDE